MSEHTPISERGRKIAATVAEKRRRRRVEWLWRAFEHHARLYRRGVHDLEHPVPGMNMRRTVDSVRLSHAAAVEFLAELREAEPLAQLLHCPEFDIPVSDVGEEV